MDKIEIEIVGRDPSGVINATETKIYYKGQLLAIDNPDWTRLRNNLTTALREWSRDYLFPGKESP